MFVKEFLLINLDTTLVVDTKLNISGYFLPNPSPPPKKEKISKKLTLLTNSYKSISKECESNSNNNNNNEKKTKTSILNLYSPESSNRPATLLKKRLWHKCLPVNFAKFLRTPFL